MGPRDLRLLSRYWELLHLVARGGVLCRTLLRRDRRDAGVPNATHYLQCGGGHSGTPLGVTGSRNSGGRQQQWQQGGTSGGGKDAVGKGQRTKAGREGTCASEGEGRVILRG